MTAQRIAKESLQTNGYTSELKLGRYRDTMMRLVRRVAHSLDPRYPSLGEHSALLDDEQVKHANNDGVMGALNRILQSDDDSD